MGTEGRVACPVCGEGFGEPPARCFRCETDLSRWWPLDEALGAIDAGARLATTPSADASTPILELRPRARPWLPVLLGAALGALVAAVVASVARPRPPGVIEVRAPVASPRPTAVAPLPSPRVSPSSLRYVVQPGDSLWRIAAALRGDGRRWADLLVEGEAVDPARLRPGQELRVRLDETETPAR